MNSDQIIIREVAFRSPEYFETLKLRDKLLRKPLGLQFDEAQLAQEWKDYHLAAFDEANNLIACLILSPKNSKAIKMRQVAVADEWQGTGIGKKLVRFSEEFAGKRGFEKMFCNARQRVEAFYKKLGYHTVGKPFEEVSILHVRMEKELDLK